MPCLLIRVFIFVCLLAGCQPTLAIKGDKTSSLVIGNLVFTSDGSSLAYTAYIHSDYGAWTSSFGLWGLTSGKVKNTSKAIKHQIKTIFFSPDGKELALMYQSGFKTNYGFIWHIDRNKLSEKQSYMPDYLGPESMVVISPDKKLTAEPDLMGRIRLWNNATGKIVKTYQFEHIKTINAIQFTPNSKRLVIVGQYSPPYRYDSSEKNKYQGSTLVISFDLSGKSKDIVLDTKNSFVSYQRSGHRLVTETRDTINIWNSFKQTLIQKINYIGGIKQKQLSNNAHFMAALTHSDLIILPEGKPIEMENRSVVVIWDIKTGLPFHVLTDGTRSTTVLAISPDNKTLATGDDQGVIRLWNMKTGKVIKQLAVQSLK